ncbi:hypothetical protein Vadar_009028 [Vaccinium darrowii]|uniref:Uncharacterized protein n=1 Tax=Vaccinium darrowii TaxID=229202 RepID=A0ACB7XP88_9ERIC|nr:hypothetical protein Vadar_009028 [Vaccinium darrowii]
MAQFQKDGIVKTFNHIWDPYKMKGAKEEEEEEEEVTAEEVEDDDSESDYGSALGLEHASQIWEILEQRFNSVSRTHVHDLKRQLYNVTKTSTLEAYFDTIKQLAYKSAAAGAPVSEEDLIFYTMHGLPTEFDTLQTALSARVGNITFEELVSILNGEEMRRNRSAGINTNTDVSTSVFMAVPRTPTSGNLTVGQLPQQQGVLSSTSQIQSQQMPTMQQQQMPVMPQQSSPMYGASYPQSYNNFRNQRNGSRGFRNQRNGSRPACQICDKTNHTAKNCHHRLNLQYQPQTYNNPHMQPYPQAHMLQYNHPSIQPSVTPMQYNNPSVAGPSQVPSPSFTPGLLPTPPQAYFTPTQTVPYQPQYTPPTQYTSPYPIAPSFSSTVPVTSGNWTE